MYLNAEWYESAFKHFSAAGLAIAELQKLKPDDVHAAEVHSNWRFNVVEADRKYARLLGRRGDHSRLTIWITDEAEIPGWPWELRTRIRLREAAMAVFGASIKQQNDRRDWFEARVAELQQHADELPHLASKLDWIESTVSELQYGQLSAPDDVPFGDNGQAVLNGDAGRTTGWIPDSQTPPATAVNSFCVSSHPGTMVDLHELLGARNDAVSLARTRFRLPQAGRVRFQLGSDDAMSCWLDGQYIYDAVFQRGSIWGTTNSFVTCRLGSTSCCLKSLSTKERGGSESMLYPSTGNRLSNGCRLSTGSKQ